MESLPTIRPPLANGHRGMPHPACCPLPPPRADAPNRAAYRAPGALTSRLSIARPSRKTVEARQADHLRPASWPGRSIVWPYIFLRKSGRRRLLSDRHGLIVYDLALSQRSFNCEVIRWLVTQRTCPWFRYSRLLPQEHRRAEAQRGASVACSSMRTPPIFSGRRSLKLAER